MFQFGEYTLDVDSGHLRTAQREIELRPKSFEVLRCLVENGGRLVGKDELIKAVWPNVTVTDESLTQCISEVRQAIGDRDQTKIRTVPRRGYRFVMPILKRSTESLVAIVSEAESNDTADCRADQPVADRPSIAVLPFLNLSGDSGQEYFCDGVTEDIITELSRFSELLVIARTSSFQYKGKAIDVRQVARQLGVRYVLEGSVRRGDNRVRVAVQLIDAETGAHRWADRYDGERSDDLAIQDQIVRSIVTILAAHVRVAETERTLLKPPASWEAYDYYLRGAEAFRLAWMRRTRDLICEARRLLDRSLAIDPGYARAYAMLARTYTLSYLEPVDDDYRNRTAVDRAYELAKKAIELDPNLPESHSQLGWVLLWLRQHDAALGEFERAIKLNPNYNDLSYGHCLIFAGEPERAIDFLLANTRIDPFQFRRLAVTGHANYTLRRYKDALPPLQECASYAASQRVTHLWLAASCAQLGDVAAAQAAAADALKIEPGFTVDKFRCHAVYRNLDDAEHIYDGLRKAGFPE